MLISLIVPCYNEEEAMPLFYKEASRVAAEMKASPKQGFCPEAQCLILTDFRRPHRAERGRFVI